MMITACFFLAMMAGSPDTARGEIERLFRDYETGRMSEAYRRLSSTLRGRTGPVQLEKYLDTRRDAYGKLVNVGTPSVAADAAPRSATNDQDQYEVELKFEKGTVTGEFGFVEEGKASRLDYFALPMPKDRPAVLSESTFLPVARELLDLGAREGALAMYERLSSDVRPETPEADEAARASTTRVNEWLGRLTKYTPGPIESAGADNCRKLTSEGVFERGTGEILLELCWADGLWQLRHSSWKPDITPPLIEKVCAGRLPGNGRIECPGKAALPIGGTIVCRVTADGEPPTDATILRTTRSGIEIVALTPAK